MLADLFPGRERLLLGGVLASSLVAALFETVGVASILPFMALVLDPSALARYPVFAMIARSIGATSPKSQLLVLGLVTALIVALGNVTAALNVFIGERFVARTHTRIASRLFAGYLRQPYRFHLERDAPSLIKVVLNDVQLVVLNVISQALLALSKGLMALGVLVLLFLRDPALAMTVTVVLGGAYGITFRSIRARQKRLGADLNRYNLDQFRISQEGLGGVKELQVLGREIRNQSVCRLRARCRERCCIQPSYGADSTLHLRNPRIRRHLTNYTRPNSEHQRFCGYSSPCSRALCVRRVTANAGLAASVLFLDQYPFLIAIAESASRRFCESSGEEHHCA